MPQTTPTSAHITPIRQPHADVEPHCVLEVWDTARRAWTADAVAYPTIAEATAAAIERGVYRIVLVGRGQRLELDVFAVV